MSFAQSFGVLVLLATSAVAQIATPSTSTATPASTGLPADCARDYTVRLGDTCDSISAELNVSTFQLAQVNAGRIDAACDNLALGEPLCLGITGQDCNITTVIQSGDFCWMIAGNAGISLPLLLQNNPNVDSNCTNIYPGEVLCTATQVFVQS